MGAVLCLKASKVFQLIQQRDGAFADLWSEFIVHDGLYPSPQTQSGSAGELPIVLSDASGQVGPSCPKAPPRPLL